MGIIGVTSLVECSVWLGLNEPTWLQKDPYAWPKMSNSSEHQFDSVTLEEKTLGLAAQQKLPSNRIFPCSSSLLKLVRSTAWIFRISNNRRIRNEVHRRSPKCERTRRIRIEGTWNCKSINLIESTRILVDMLKDRGHGIVVLHDVCWTGFTVRTCKDNHTTYQSCAKHASCEKLQS